MRPFQWAPSRFLLRLPCDNYKAITRAILGTVLRKFALPGRHRMTGVFAVRDAIGCYTRSSRDPTGIIHGVAENTTLATGRVHVVKYC